MIFLEDKLSAVFNSTFRAIEVKEGFNNCTIIYEGFDFHVPPEKELAALFTEIQNGDTFEFNFVLDETNPVTFQSSVNAVADLEMDLTSQFTFYDKGKQVKIRIDIRKGIGTKEISIYHLPAFAGALKEISFEEILDNLNGLLKNQEVILFRCHHHLHSFETRSIQFCQKEKGEYSAGIPLKERLLKADKMKSVTSFSNPGLWTLLPDDFYITGTGGDIIIKSIFDKLAYWITLAFLYDITSIKDDHFTYKLNGYKAIHGKLSSTDNVTSVKDYYDIYNWVYDGGNLIDKIGLSRNILSFHLKNNNSTEIDANAYPSILSSYKVYQKQNLRQYIELRNKLGDQLLGFNEKAGKIADDFASGFKKSAFGVISLFSSIIVIRIITNKDFENIFTRVPVWLSLAFLLISLVYLFICRVEFNSEKKRFVKGYQNMKRRNEDLLSKEDIERILNSDKEFNEYLKFIEQKKMLYTILWLATVFILGCLAIYLYSGFKVELIKQLFGQ